MATRRRQRPNGGSERTPEPAAATTTVAAPETVPDQRVRVIRGIPNGGGSVIEPGSILTVGKDLPYHRVRQFIEQRYVVALEPDAE
jgi:hypothetical protein